jgi:hypothetical protein
MNLLILSESDHVVCLYRHNLVHFARYFEFHLTCRSVSINQSINQSNLDDIAQRHSNQDKVAFHHSESFYQKTHSKTYPDIKSPFDGKEEVINCPKTYIMLTLVLDGLEGSGLS